VITHADAETARNPVKDNGGDYGWPAPEKKPCDRGNMAGKEKNPHTPIRTAPIDPAPRVSRHGFPIIL
jgi:hypothetical protein